MALDLDFLTRIINVSWGLVDQQGLLAEYPPGPGAPDFESIQDVMKGTPIAYALDSGRTFPGVNMGASGLGYTVLTPGLICFGKPRDGDACFLACPGFEYYASYGGSDALKKGILDDDGKLVWSGTGGGGGKLLALTFAEDAFFAIYDDTATASTTIATSFDGDIWLSGSAFPASGDLGALGGAVAATFKIVKDEDNKDKKIVTYVAAGLIVQDNSEFRNSHSNLMWATSINGHEWISNSNMGMLAEPGIWFDIINDYACTIASGSVDKDRQVFVAAAATKTEVPDPRPFVPPLPPFAMLTTGAAVSETGNEWDTIKLPGALAAGLDQESWGLAVTFVQTETNGYFLLSDHELISGGLGHAIPQSNLYKSFDGRTWSKIRTNNNWMTTLSTIAKDLGATTIIHI